MIHASRLQELPVRRPRAVLVWAALATAALGAGMARLEVDASIETMIVEGDPDHAAYEARQDVFGTDELVAVAIPFGDLGDALEPEALALQRRVVRALELLPGVAEVDALATSDDIYGRDATLMVDPLVPEDRAPAELSAAERAHVRERVEQNPVWTGFLISRDRKVASIQVRLREHDVSTESQAAAVAAIDGRVREILGERPYYLAGHPFMKTEIARTMTRDLLLFMPVSLAVMMLFLLLGAGSWGAAAITLSGVLVAIVWMLGAMGWAGHPVTALSNTAPSILLALGTAYFMHFAAAYQDGRASGAGAEDAVRQALARVRQPTVVAALTTAAGFGSLVVSRLPIVRGFGAGLAVGVLGIGVLGCFALPAAFVLGRPRVGRGALGPGRRFGRSLFQVARVGARHPWAILAASVVLLALSVDAATRLEIDSSGPERFARDSRFRVSSEFYRRHLSGDVVENIYLRAPGGGFQDPDRLRRMRALQAAAEELPEIDKTVSIADYVALMNRAIFDNDPAEARIPDTPQAVAQYLLLYSASGDPEEFDDLVSSDYSEARILLLATVPSSRASAELRGKLEALVERYFPDEGGPRSVLSTEILLSQAADVLVEEQVRGFSLALLLVLSLVTLAFRSVRAGLLMIMPNGLPIALNLGVMSAAGIALNDGSSIVSATALGIAVDSTVHLLAAVRRSESVHGSRRGAVLEALLVTGRPVTMTSLIIVAGFSVLILSEFRTVAELGALTALTMLYCLAADLFVLPAQLLAPWRRLARRLGLPVAPRSDGASPILVAGCDAAVPALVVGRSGGALRLRPLGGSLPARSDDLTLTWLEGGERREGVALEGVPGGCEALVRLREPRSAPRRRDAPVQPEPARSGGVRAADP